MPVNSFIQLASNIPNDFPEITATIAQSRTFYYRIMDICGEAERVERAYFKYKNEPSEVAKKSFDKQIQTFHKACCYIYNDDDIRYAMKWTLRVAELELLDFCHENQLNNTSGSALGWFKQWYTIGKQFMVF